HCFRSENAAAEIHLRHQPSAKNIAIGICVRRHRDGANDQFAFRFLGRLHVEWSPYNRSSQAKSRDPDELALRFLGSVCSDALKAPKFFMRPAVIDAATGFNVCLGYIISMRSS